MNDAEINLIGWAIIGGLALIGVWGYYTDRRREKKIMAEIGPQSAIENWFEVSFDAESVYLNVAAPGRDPWQSQFRWRDIIRICFKTEEPGLSDGIYFFTSTRPQSYVVPTEAKGGSELWNEVLRRGLFDARLAIEAACCPEEKCFFWPPEK